MPTNKRIIMAKMGLDSHDNGLRIVSKWLADGGYEVIYAGVYNSAERILRMVDRRERRCRGHQLSRRRAPPLFPESSSICFRENDLKDVKLFAGGIIPPADVVTMKDIGVDAVFTPGTPRGEILKRVAACLSVSGGVPS